MRRLIYLEMKRVITTRSVWVMLAVIILLSAVLAYFPITFVKTEQIDEQGNITLLQKTEAVDCIKEKEKEINGEITEEKIRKAILVFQECYREYGSVFPPDMPAEEYIRRIEPIYPVLEMAAIVLAPKGVSLYTMTDADIAPGDAARFYEAFREKLSMEGETDAEQKKIRELSQNIKMPFTYVPGCDFASFEYLTMYMLLLMLVFAVVISPIFSAEYQTGADSILRCTRHGRAHLAFAKIITALLIFAAVFAVGTGIFLLITNLAFGTEGLKASMQTVWGVFLIPAFTAGQVQTALAAEQFLSVLATVSCILFLSASCKNAQDSLKASMLISLLPMIIGMISSKNLARIIRCILPSGGIGLSDSFLFELLGTNFVHVGGCVIWTPYLVIGAAVVEIPLFLFLTVRVYCRRESM